MKEQIKVIIALVFVITAGLLVVHKKAVSPTVQTPVPEIKLPDQTPLVQKPELEEKEQATSAPVPVSDFLLTEKDAGKTFTIKKRKTFTLSIPERAGGYDSISMSYQAFYLDLLDHGLKPSSGNPGTRTWTFKALTPGTSMLTITAIAQKGDASLPIFSNTVVVTE